MDELQSALSPQAAADAVVHAAGPDSDRHWKPRALEDLLRKLEESGHFGSAQEEASPTTEASPTSTSLSPEAQASLDRLHRATQALANGLKRTSETRPQHVAGCLSVRGHAKPLHLIQ
mmetsp:Transcript_70507/g.153742  ORF Transcript_70507/g.153742 Transcript_70507/m.153742 type:complete len:118 (+) Transcript_70507:83-436(+)